MRLVTLAQARAHLRMDHTADDPMIDDLIQVSSEAVINYLKDIGNDAFMDSSGDLLGEDVVPRVVQQAVLVMVGVLYRIPHGEGGMINPAFAPGYLPPPVMSLLYPLRDPALR